MESTLNIPWWTKITAKIVLSRLPLGYAVWKKLGLFRHGSMDQFGYVKQVFDRHAEVAGLAGRLEGSTILEFGPGDSIASAILGASYRARTILIDAGDYAAADVEFYQGFVESLSASGNRAPSLAHAKDRNEVLDRCNAEYLTEGLDSLKSIPTGSVDLIFSQAVLEHVRRHQFFDTLREFRRILKKDGIASHRVDLKDHLGGGLNNMRFSHQIWESEFFAKSGFYTNRIRFSEMIDLMVNAGFYVDVIKTECWESLPLSRSSVSKNFSDLSDDDLLVKGFDVVMKPMGQ
jgi:SAM-dependent methyltransferase